MYDYTKAPTTGEDMKLFIVWFALQHLGQPGIWGGNGAYPDCSGFMINVLEAAGYQMGRDRMAKEIYPYLIKEHGFKPVTKMQSGDVVFWGNSIPNIGHVDLAINDRQVIGAIGVRPSVRNLDDANVYSAMVKIRSITYRKGEKFILRMPSE